jgi:hypothetical protein
MLAGTTGCGKTQKSYLPPTAEVSGTVTLDGEPLPQATIHFVPDAEKGTQGPIGMAATDGNGKYEVVSAGVTGAVVGFHKIQVWARRRPPIPGKYNYTEISGLRVEVKGGRKNDIPVLLKSDPVKPGAEPEEDNSFSGRLTYSTDVFQFDVPRPWYCAIPDSNQKENVARCFLHSRLAIAAKGILLVNAGRATGTIGETIDRMITVMKGGNDSVEIQREDIVLNRDKAVYLKSAVADYRVPCSVIVDDHKGTLYLIMMSVSEKSDLENRDLMFLCLSKSWMWKELSP